VKWKFLNTNHRGGKFNMEFDEFLAEHLQEGIGLPTLRIYGWKPPAISIGFNQDINDFNIDKLQATGIDIVRRPTGGRAILHWHELTYSVVMPSNNEGPRAIYQFISEALLKGLQLLGIEAQLSSSNANFKTLYQSPSSIPCFASSAKSEILFDNKKLIGSAQRRFGNITLQHGSFLLGPQHRNIVDYLSQQIESSKIEIEESLLSKTIDAETILRRYVSFDEAAECIKNGFEEACDISLVTDTIFADEYSFIH
jgi:lipoate-protein ligase A